MLLKGSDVLHNVSFESISNHASEHTDDSYPGNAIGFGLNHFDYFLKVFLASLNPRLAHIFILQPSPEKFNTV